MIFIAGYDIILQQVYKGRRPAAKKGNVIMELLEFKEKTIELCGVGEVQEIGDVLISKVLKNDTGFFDKYLEAVDDSKDWLQALWQYYNADRKEKKQDYTPASLCKLVSRLAGECKTVYDCCGGSGALTKFVAHDHSPQEVFVEELDESVMPFLLFNLCLSNASGFVINGNVLTREIAKVYKLTAGEKYSKCEIIDRAPKITADVAVSNPPFNIAWDAPVGLAAAADGRFPVDLPRGNANFAFVFNCLAKANRAVVILPCGVFSDPTSTEARRYLADSDFLESVILCPRNMFESTDIATCILVLDKNKKNKRTTTFVAAQNVFEQEVREQNGQFGGASHTGRTYKKIVNVFSDKNISDILDAIKKQGNVPDFCKTVTTEEIAKNEYLYQPSRYIDFGSQRPAHRDFKEIAENINYITKMQNSCKLVINETLAQKLGFDLNLYKRDRENSKNLRKQMALIGISVDTGDYIQFTKNKNEFVFKCNDKELLPEMLLQFLSVWKNQIALLNTMQNQYLEELRDALIPDLMLGEISIGETTKENTNA